MSEIDLWPRHIPNFNGLTAAMRRMLIEHIDAPQPAAPVGIPVDPNVMALSRRQLLRFDTRRINRPRCTMLTESGRHVAFAFAAYEAERLTELENAK